MRASTHVRDLALTAALPLAVSLFTPLGCRQVLSFEERVLDDSADVSCETYCGLVTSLCTGANSQYSSEEACLGFCATIPPGTLDDTGVHSVGCRIRLLQDKEGGIETADCTAAGPASKEVCGTTCEAYCTGMVEICDGVFESKGDCTAECENFEECGGFTVDPEATTPDDPSLDCRMYHLQVASKDTSSRDIHCPHASGTTECIFDDAFTCGGGG